jgi:hypothetical protein
MMGAQAHGRTGRGLLLALMLVVPGSVTAQEIESPLVRPSDRATVRPGVPTAVRVGKWATLAGSVFFGVSAYQAHQDAEASYDALLDRCRTVTFACLLDEDGSYIDPASERHYAATRDADRRAARYLIGSEVLFVATAAGFIWELTHREERPGNIPFVPRISPSRSETRISWSLSF